MDASLDLPRTQRIVLLIDLQPLLSLQNRNSYLSSILSAAHKIISYPPLSSSLSAFKLFFSCLSPILSTSNVHRLLGKSPTFLSFDRPHRTLDSLSKSFSSLLAIPDLGVSGSPQASLLARSLIQLEHDYAWQVENRKGTRELLQFRSNLAVLFSSISKDSTILAEYVESKMDVDGSVTVDVFLKKFVQAFRQVKERLIPRDIHLSLIDVNYGSECKEDISRPGWFERGFRELGWGYSSTDAIVLGSVLIPFGLLYPYIGCSLGYTADRSSKNRHAELVLGIADASGKPLECTGCNLDVLDLKLLSERSIISIPFLENFCSKITKVHVTGVWKKEKGEKITKNAVALAIIRGFSGTCRKDVKQHADKFFTDRVLELLCLENSEIAEHKPFWQLLLAFLYGRNYCAVVSIFDSDGNSVQGILWPFTINYVLVHIIEKGSVSLCQSDSRVSDGSPDVLNSCTYGASQDKNARRKRSKLRADLLQSTTWNSFREVLLNYANDDISGVDLDELYLSREHTNSKKLRFLKCWMRQIKNSFSSVCQIIQPEAEEHINATHEAGRIMPSEEEAGASLVSSSIKEAVATDKSRHVGEEAPAFSCLDDLEAFLGSIHQKIEQGLHSEDADLGILAERLVGLSIHALYRKLERETIKDSEVKEDDGASDAKVASEVSHLLLSKPKDLILKYKGTNPASVASNSISANYSTEYKIREHELQVCFRMEILRSDVSASFGDSMKQKMIKEICTLLQFVDINLQGHSVHAEDIFEFAQRAIKSRYNDSLGAVIQKIYNKMEFDLFVEVEASDSLHNSNDDDVKNSDSNDRIHKNSVGPTIGAPTYQATHQEDAEVHHRLRDHKHEQQLIRAQERRNRDRRFSSFTSWVPDLHRVWAIKQTRTEKPIHELLPKPSKRRKRTTAAHDMVCETPMTVTKHSQERKDADCFEIKSCKSLPKALFHHEGDLGSNIIS